MQIWNKLFGRPPQAEAQVASADSAQLGKLEALYSQGNCIVIPLKPTVSIDVTYEAVGLGHITVDTFGKP